MFRKPCLRLRSWVGLGWVGLGWVGLGVQFKTTVIGEMLESSVMLFADRICTAPPTRVANSGAGVPASRALPIPSTSLHTYPLLSNNLPILPTGSLQAAGLTQLTMIYPFTLFRTAKKRDSRETRRISVRSTEFCVSTVSFVSG